MLVCQASPAHEERAYTTLPIHGVATYVLGIYGNPLEPGLVFKPTVESKAQHRIHRKHLRLQTCKSLGGTKPQHT